MKTNKVLTILSNKAQNKLANWSWSSSKL